ncbi:hypothetical protein [Prosthecobacter sp.]|uniref:hypothetical protein n=1 Tax=Prosthecobacter sp. TaxID=1965333 RepID=UPI00378362BA
MNHAPGIVSTEPLPGALGSPFSPIALEIVPRAISGSPRHAPVSPPNPYFSSEQEAALPAELQATVLHPAPSPLQPAAKAAATGLDLPAQIEQLRNDIFGIAMNVSALNDRLDRLEQRVPPAGQSAQAGIATLRGEIEVWLEKHLNAAVEHCMHQIISRQNTALSQTAN